MQVLPEPIDFEWDQGNLDKNWKRHKVSTKEAEETFFNKPVYLFKDTKHSLLEKRYGFFSYTNNGRLLALVFTIRNNKIRIITARDIHKKERIIYEKETKINSKI